MMRRFLFTAFFLLLSLSMAVEARTAYQYLAPDGSLVFTDEELEAPFKLVSKVRLTWGSIKEKEIEKKIVQPKTPDYFSKALNHRKFAGIIYNKARKYRIVP